MSKKNMVWIVAGPTAIGKSQLALDIAKASNGAIVNADSMQIYSEIPILSAQPSGYDRKLVPHYLYGFQPITKTYSAATWAAQAKDAIYDCIARDLQPILVGGSGLYLQGLLEGFSAMPGVPPAIRKQITDLYDMLGAQRFHETLKKIDPEAAARLHPTDRQRCIRAREIYEVSGETLTSWQAQPKQNIAPDLDYRTVILLPPRDWLYNRINNRFAIMVEHGAIEEARAVHDLHLDNHHTGSHALGLQALCDYLDGRLTLGEATENGQSQSRQYAKRQYTWFRNQALPNAVFLCNPEEDWLAMARKHLHTA
jgi:tRNA dimethylallyltransferase